MHACVCVCCVSLGELLCSFLCVSELDTMCTVVSVVILKFIVYLLIVLTLSTTLN